MDLKKVSIPILAAVVIIGAMLRREYVNLGEWITLVAIIYFLVVSFVPITSFAFRYNSLPIKKRARVWVYALFIVIVVHTLVTGSPNYFYIIALFAAEYLLTYRPKSPSNE